MTATSLVRWIARAASAALTALFVIMVVGQWPPPVMPLSWHTLQFALLGACIAGLILAWRLEVVGASIALCAMLLFYLVDVAQTGFKRFPTGWVFPAIFGAAALFAIAALLDQKQAGAGGNSR